MKKISKLILIFLCSIVFIVIIYMCIVMFVTFAPDKHYEKMANNHSKIEYFMDMKKDDNYLVVSKDILAGNYYIDSDDLLYLSIKTAEFVEGDKPTDSDFLYKIIMVNKIDEGKTVNKIDSIGDITINIYSKNIISVYAYIDGDLNSTSNTRYYQLIDNDYNQIVNNALNAVENGLLYKCA